ncbi:HD family phosphohydrolase [Balneola sp. MJW-20]|uniref:HD family phosphohydrolase n=1 Tax=Gracilimonas aurantiaca TaxID=3234185 RepID=UPI0034678943
MKFLERLGLGQKKKELSPLLGEKKKKEQEKYSFRKNPFITLLIFFLFIIISVISLPRNIIDTPYSYTINQPWRANDLSASFGFAIKKTKQELERERDQIRSQTTPIFRVDPNAAIGIQTRIDSIYREIQPVLNTYNAWQEAKQSSVTSFNDSLRFAQAFNASRIGISQSSWDVLFESTYRSRIQNSNEEFIGSRVKTELEELVLALLDQGIIDRQKSNMDQNQVTLRNMQTSTDRPINLARLRDMKEASDFAQFRFNRLFDEPTANLAMELYRMVIMPNYLYSEEDTQAQIQEAFATISETKGAISQGQVIIRKGDLVTEEKANILESLAEARAVNASRAEKWIRFGGQIVVIVVITFVFFMYIYLYRRSITSDNAMFLLVFITLGLICLSAGLLNLFDLANPYVVPVAIAPIILTIIFDSRVGLVAGITLAALLGLVNGNNFQYIVATFTACSLGVFSVRDIKDRSQFFFTTPGIVFVTYVVVVGAFALVSLSGWEDFLTDLMYIAISAVFILFTYPIILLFEKIFGVTTDFTLLELGDTNNQLLKELMNKAPGTFHHSLQVANLSEAAAAAIGANSLLCRVGALYHDIGKMVKPEYFVENQTRGSNEHEKLKPQMSAMVIKSHVSEGMKMAEEHDLPKVITDFIETHHGTSVIRYFYEKAKEDEKLRSMLQEDQFRYEGPLPFSKETGIVLLADGIEAASRAMKNPTYSKLENLVNKMVDDRVAEGQLSHSPLTFRHLQIIKETFLNIQVGVYHSRVEYPEDSDKKDNKAAKESQEETTTQSN